MSKIDSDGWKAISTSRAWALAADNGKSPPYAGYMLILDDGVKLRCIQDEKGTRFEAQECGAKPKGMFR